MGLLDGNFTKTQFKEQRNLTAISLSVITPTILTNRIDCKGFNFLQLSMRAYTEIQDVNIIGIFPDGSTTLNTMGLSLVEVTNNNKENISIKRSVKKVFINYEQQFLVDVSKFDFISINKLNANGSLNYWSILSTALFDDTKYDFETFKSLKPYDAVGNDKTVTIPFSTKENAVVFKIEGDTSVTSIRLNNSSVETNSVYCINKGRYLKFNDTLDSGVNYLAVPITEDKKPILLNLIGSFSLGFRFDSFYFDISKPKIYFKGQNGVIGAGNEITIPKNAKFGKVTIIANVASNNMLLELYGRKESVITPNTNNLSIYSSLSLLPFYDADLKATTPSIKVSTVNKSYYFDVSFLGTVSVATNASVSNLDTYLQFYEDVDNDIENAIRGTTSGGDSTSTEKKYFKTPTLGSAFENDSLTVLKTISGAKITGLLKDAVVWQYSTGFEISKAGVDGDRTNIILNNTNFPNLIAGSSLEHVILLYWQRNATTGYAGENWRVNVITDKGQVYHNFPSRGISDDGVEQTNDWISFEESVIWEHENKTTPVKTKAGTDATLIATEKYNYFPALPDEAYEFHPAVNATSPYGNNGFPAVNEKTQFTGGTPKFSRFYFTDRSGGLQANPLGFMGGFETNQKLSMLATYKSNSSRPTRMCVFMTNDGGRQWYCRWESGMYGERRYPNESVISAGFPIYLPRDFKTTAMGASASSGVFNVVKRSQYVPDETNKEIEKTKKFSYSTAVAVTSIVSNPSDITVTATAHGFTNGELILFTKQNGTANEWDWIVNSNTSDVSGGNGVFFKVNLIDVNSFKLKEAVGYADNNLLIRHIHSLNKVKAGFVFGTGETYPDGGWIYYIPIRESDSFIRKYPYDLFQFVRLNSTIGSIQRPLGLTIEQDKDNTVFIGVDNEYTPLNDVSMPVGRTDTFKRNSQGVWKGKLIDVDDQNLFECTFESDEVCYFFKKILGNYVYTGQQGHFGISKTGERGTWTELHTPNVLQRYGGFNNEGWFVIDGYLFKKK